MNNRNETPVEQLTRAVVSAMEQACWHENNPFSGEITVVSSIQEQDLRFSELVELLGIHDPEERLNLWDKLQDEHKADCEVCQFFS